MKRARGIHVPLDNFCDRSEIPTGFGQETRPRCPIGFGCLQDVGFPDTDGVRSGRAPWLHGREASLGVLSFRWIGHSFGFYGLFLLHNLFG